jgi:serine/threonine protein kinase
LVEHLDDNAASEFVSGSLPPSALGKVEGHLASCRECRALVAALAADSGDDSNLATVRHDRLTGSGSGELPRRTLSIGDRVGRYLVLSSLGSGGMGVVFAAYDPQLDRKIALKLLRSGIAVSTKDARTRLRREAQAIAQLSHPNVVSVYDVGTTDDGDLYIAMEFVEGDTLTSWLRNYPRTWREIIDVFLQAARGLWSAHGVGLLHRDFKPDNVLVGGDGRVRVTDFGLARSVLAPDEAMHAKPVMTALNLALTVTGTVLGTPRYMPPEQLTGPAVDARSDQFSFCVALYEALYGTHPLRDGTAIAMLDHGDHALPPPEGTRIPAAVGRAVLRGLEREQARRFPSMGALIDELVPRPRRSPVRFAGFALAGVLLAGGATAALVAQQHGRPEPSDTTRIDVLNEQLKRKEIERQELLGKLEQARVDHAELVRLRAALQQKDEEIRQLANTVSMMQVAPIKLVAPIKKVRAAGPTQSILVVGALADAQRPIEGCFDEWAERNQGTHDEVAEATMVVVLAVTPDGVGTMPRVTLTPDKHPVVAGAESDGRGAPPAGSAPAWGRGSNDAELGMSMLEFCVSEQIVRVRFPPGPERLDVEATVLWSQGLVNLSPRVTGHHPGPRHAIELP